MITDPVSLFFEEVVPAYENFVGVSKKKDNKKFVLMGAAMQAADRLFHFREALVPVLPHKNLTRSEMNKFYDYDLLGDVFNAHKHGHLDPKRKKGEVLLAKREDIEETLVSTYFLKDGEPTTPRNFFGVVQNRILVYPKKGGVRDFLEVATNVINCWSDFLITEGLTDKFIKFRYEGDDILTQEQAAEIGVNSNPIPVRVDGSVRWAMIARYYEPQTMTFNRWGFNDKGHLVAVQIPENAPNAKLYGYLKS